MYPNSWFEERLPQTLLSPLPSKALTLGWAGPTDGRTRCPPRWLRLLAFGQSGLPPFWAQAASPPWEQPEAPHLLQALRTLALASRTP